MELFLKTEDLAKRILNSNQSYYSEELLRVIPRELLRVPLIDENIDELISEINMIRLQTENELAKLAGLPPNWRNKRAQRRKWKRIIAGELNELLDKDQQKRRKETKFLFEIAASIARLRRPLYKY